MARSTNKGTMLETTSAEARRALDRCSKAALIDALCAVVALNEGHCDDPPTLGELGSHLRPVLTARGDRIPPGL